MSMRCLSQEELLALTERVDFSRAAKEMITTADVKPIDIVLGQALSSWPSFRENFPGWQSLEWKGVLVIPAAPKSLQARLPAKHRQERQEPLEFLIQGVEVDGAPFVFIENLSSHGRRSLWGVDVDNNRLLYGRGLDIEPVQALANLGPTLESQALDQAARHGAPRSSTPRV